MGPASRELGWFIVLILCLIGMMEAEPTSLNRLNLGASMKVLGHTYAVSSSFAYDLIYDLPNITDNQKPAELLR